MLIVSSACLLTAGKVTLANIVPPELALKMALSVIAPVPSEASNEQIKVIVLLDALVESSASLLPRMDTKSVCPAAAAVVPDPTAM